MLQANEIKVDGKYKVTTDEANCYAIKDENHGGFENVNFVIIRKIADNDWLTYDVIYKDGHKNPCSGCLKPRHLGLLSETLKTTFSIGDTVKIIKRLPGNRTGTEDYRLENGDVGKIGKIIDYGSQTFRVDRDNEYLGRFKAEELEIANDFNGEISKGSVVKITAVQGGIVSMDLGHSIRITNNGSIEPKKEKSFMVDAIKFVKEQALKVANPDEFELRKADLHDNCGDLTTEGRALRDSFLEELVLAKMVTTARAMNEEAKANK